MNSIATAISTINVPFHGANLFIVNHNGEPFTPMKPIVEGIGMDWASQFTKLKQRFSKGIAEITIPSAGGSQSMTCLALRKLNGWLQTISPNKVNPDIRDKVIQYQEECDDVLYEYWTKGEVKNPRKAKKKIAGKITAEQQEAIKQLVMMRGKMLPKENQAKAMITMWSSLKSHFGCSYKNIADDQFAEALSLAARIPLDGEFIGKQESLSKPELNLNYGMNFFDKYCWVVGTKALNSPWFYSPEMLIASGDYPNPCGLMLMELKAAGYSVDAAIFQLQALQHHLCLSLQKIERVKQVIAH